MFYVFLYLRAQFCDLYIKCELQKKSRTIIKWSPIKWSLFDPSKETDIRFPFSQQYFFSLVFYPTIHLSLPIFLYLFIVYLYCLSAYHLSISLCVWLYFSISIYQSIDLLLPVCLFHLSVSVCLSIYCLSIYLSMSLHTWLHLSVCLIIYHKCIIKTSQQSK